MKGKHIRAWSGGSGNPVSFSKIFAKTACYRTFFRQIVFKVFLQIPKIPPVVKSLQVFHILPLRSVCFLAAALGFCGLAMEASAQQLTLFSTNFATNVLSGTNAGSVEWTTQPSVTMLNSGNVTSLNGYNFSVRGNFSTVNNLSVNSNLNTANQTTLQRGFSVDFSVSGTFYLSRLTVRAGHINNEGNKQVYVSTLNYRIVRLPDLAVVASGNRSFDYAGTDVFFDRVFTLSGDLLAGTTYRLEIGMNNLVSGGAFAIYGGVTLEAYPEPGSNPRFAQRLNFAKFQKDLASAENGSYIADLALDGIVSNFHSWRTGSQTGAQSLEISYPRSVTLGSAHLYSGIWTTANATQVWQNYRLQYHDGSTWIDVPGAVVGTNTDPERNILFSSPVTASRYRLLTSNTTATSRTLREIAMFPPNPNGSGIEQGYPIGTDVNINLSRQRPVVASSSNGTNYALNAVDGFVDDSSRWLCTPGTPGQTLEIDLLDTHAIGSAHLYSGDLATQTNALAAFTLESWNTTNSTWETIPGATITGNTQNARVVTFSSPVSTSRVRLVVNDTSSARVAELLLFPPRSGGYPLGQDVRVEPRPAATWNDFGDATHRIRIMPTPDRRLGLVNGIAVFTDNTAGSAAVDWQLLLNYRDGSYRIRNAATGLCLALGNISTASNTPVIGETYSGMPHQNWYLEYVSPTRFRILNAYSGLALQSQGASSILGTPMVVVTPSTSRLQQWDTARQTHYPKKGIAGTGNIPDPPFTDTSATWISHLYSQYRDASWSYTWGRQRSETFDFMTSNHTFNPMQWGNAFAHPNIPGPPETVRSDMQSSPKPMHLLGFNEPDKSNQANMTVETAVSRWPRLMAMDAPLVSPVPASTNTTTGWLVDFMDQSQALGYRVDHVAVHWYSNPDSGALIDLLQQVYDKWQRPVWLTEFSPVRWTGNSTWTTGDNYHFLAEFLWRAESLPWLGRYSLFNFRESDPTANQSAPDPAEAPRGNALRLDGSLTPYGQLYASWDGVAAVVTNKSYHLHNRGMFRRVRNPASADSVSSITPGDAVAGEQWVLIPGTTANTVRIVSARDGRRLRVTTTTNVRLEAADNVGTETEWRLTAADTAGWFYILHVATNQRLRINSSGTVLVGAATGATPDYWFRFVVPMSPEPNIPASPAVVATGGAKAVTLSWAPVPGATSYSIERLDGQTWQLVASGVTQTSWTDQSLAASTAFTYRVSAANVVGSSSPSATATATTLNPLATVGAWQAEFLASLPISQQSLSADPNGNGLPNLVEYAFGRNPTTPGASPFKINPAPAADQILIEFPWNWQATDLSWQVRTGSDLSNVASWPAAVPSQIQSRREGNVDIMTLTIPITQPERQFFYLRVNGPQN